MAGNTIPSITNIPFVYLNDDARKDMANAEKKTC